MRPALELRDLLDQVRELVRVELSLFRAEIGERTTGIPSASLRSLWGRSALRLPRAGFGCGQSLSAALRATSRPGIVMSGRAPADQGLFFGVALVASAVMSSAFFCGE
jgi:hypothetical protein